MTTYHVTPDGPRPCRDTTNRCPYLKQEKPHFDTHEEAMGHYETTMDEQFGSSGLRKTEALRQKGYAKRDQITDNARSKVAATKDKAGQLADRGRNELNMWKNDAKFVKGYISYMASQKLGPYKEKASDSSVRAAQATNRIAQKAKTGSQQKLIHASDTARRNGATVAQNVKASARVAKKVSILAGRDIARGARRIDAKYRISQRVKSAVSRVSTPVSKYVKSRAEVVKRISRTEFAPEAKQRCKTAHCSLAHKQTPAQRTLSRQRKDYFIGA